MKELILLTIVGMSPMVKYIFLAVWIAIDLFLIAIMVWSLIPHKIDKIEDDMMKSINTAFAECASKLSKEHPLGEVSLIVDNDITVTVQIELAHDVERK